MRQGPAKLDPPRVDRVPERDRLPSRDAGRDPEEAGGRKGEDRQEQEPGGVSEDGDHETTIAVTAQTTFAGSSRQEW